VKVLYVVYWGALEPLGQALVLPTLRAMAGHGAAITFVSFDKAADLASGAAARETRAALAEHAIRWISLRYHKAPTVPATAWDIVHGVLRGVLAGLRRRPDILHGRTFVGGLIGIAVARILRVPFVFHAEGFYPDERVDGGAWSADSRAYRLAVQFERHLYNQADAVVVLSEKARAQLPTREGVRVGRKPVLVVPSCVDLERFRPGSEPRDRRAPLRLVYTGNVELRYQFAELARFVAAAQRSCEVRLLVLTRADRALTSRLLREAGVRDGSWSVEAASHERVAEELRRHDAGLCFMRRGFSEHGGSPTKVGEYWASGLPVVVTPNVGDTDTIAREMGAGVVLSGHSDEDYGAAFDELRRLLDDPEVGRRCRATAERYYGLPLAVERQLSLYAELVRRL
jgi:glycosyltransferase involved in cell wall biosynthesis